MGVLNVTPDSFSDGGRWTDADAAVAHGLEMVAHGADVIDVGGESSRPGAVPVEAAVEIDRVVPVVEALAAHVRVSIDTVKPAVARAAAAAGATLLNDITASQHEVAAELGLGWVAMHMQGDPRTMQRSPRYGDVVAEVAGFLAERASAAIDAGVAEVWIDPGIGFGKTMAHNLSLLRHLDRFVAIGPPVVVGTSRKSTIGRILADSDGVAEPVPVDDRIEGSIATATWAFAAGAAMVRAHDVAPTVQAALVVGRR